MTRLLDICASPALQTFHRPTTPLSLCPDSKVHEANMGPIWGRQDPGEPHDGPMNFVILVYMMISSNGNIAALLALCEGDSKGHRYIPLTKASDADLWYLFISAWTNDWANDQDVGDLRRNRAHYDATVVIREWTFIPWANFAKTMTVYE